MREGSPPSVVRSLAGRVRGVTSPLVLCLLGLSAWPNLISGHAFGGGKSQQQVSAGLELTAHHVALDSGYISFVKCNDECRPFTILSGDTAYIGVAHPE